MRPSATANWPPASAQFPNCGFTRGSVRFWRGSGSKAPAGTFAPPEALRTPLRRSVAGVEMDSPIGSRPVCVGSRGVYGCAEPAMLCAAVWSPFLVGSMWHNFRDRVTHFSRTIAAQKKPPRAKGGFEWAGEGWSCCGRDARLTSGGRMGQHPAGHVNPACKKREQSVRHSVEIHYFAEKGPRTNRNVNQGRHFVVAEGTYVLPGVGTSGLGRGGGDVSWSRRED
jgi:hypothetical protein